MTTVYVPRLIESVEQAENLPPGTVLLGGHLDEPWDLTTFFCDQDEGCPVAMLDALTAGVRVTALVPIEAEEEHVAPDAITYSRYVTAWEEA